MDGDYVSVERVIGAPASAIFALLADAGKHSSFDGSGTVDHSAQQSVPLSLGSTFGMAMRGRKETLFLPYRTSSKVIEFEPDRRIAWQTTGLGGLIGGRIWRYELIPAGGAAGPSSTGGATLVRETWDISRDKQKPFLKRGGTPGLTERAMRATLDRIAEVVKG